MENLISPRAGPVFHPRKRTTIYPNHGYANSRKVLVVEDDLCLKMVLARFFAMLDPMIYLTWTTTAEEAERELESDTFDMVLADHFLPGRETGLQLWESCRRRHPEMRFVLMSAGSLMAGGPDRPPFLAKPFSIAECQRLLLPGLSVA